MKTMAHMAHRDQVLVYLRTEVGPRTTAQVVAAFPKVVGYLTIGALHSLKAANLASRQNVHGEIVWRAPARPAEVAHLEALYAEGAPE